MIRFGGPVFANPIQAAAPGESHGAAADDPVAIARAHRAKGFTAAYAPRVRLDDRDRIQAVRKAFAAEDVVIAEVGYWDNLVDTEPETRRRNRQCMLDALALAEELGAACAVDIFGSYCHGNGNSQHVAANFSQDAFDEAVAMARFFLDTVKPKTAFFTYEIFPFSVVDSPAMIAKLIRAVDRPQSGQSSGRRGTGGGGGGGRRAPGAAPPSSVAILLPPFSSGPAPPPPPPSPGKAFHP